jgi:hypothetical protein
MGCAYLEGCSNQHAHKVVLYVVDASNHRDDGGYNRREEDRNESAIQSPIAPNIAEDVEWDKDKNSIAYSGDCIKGLDIVLFRFRMRYSQVSWIITIGVVTKHIGGYSGGKSAFQSLTCGSQFQKSCPIMTISMMKNIPPAPAVNHRVWSSGERT